MLRFIRGHLSISNVPENFHEEDGAALIAVLVVIMIFSVLVTSIMTGFLIQSRLIDRDRDRIQARYSAEAGIYHFLADTALKMIPRSDSLRVVLEDSSVVHLTIKPFGGYLFVSSTADVHRQRSTIKTLIGEDTLPAFNNAVVLGDETSALTIAKTTEIDGDLLVGPLGMKQSEFKGELFKGRVDGLVKKDTSYPLPVYDNRFYKYEISSDDSLLVHPPRTILHIDSDEPKLSAVMPFRAHQVWYRSGDLVLRGNEAVKLPESVTIVATGNLVIGGNLRLGLFDRCIAGRKLIVTDSVTGKQVLLYAEESLELGGEVRLSGQFISPKRIILKDQSYLVYPSIIYLGGYIWDNTRKGTINLNDHSKVNGTVILSGTNRLVTGDSAKITVGKNVIIRGAIYNTGKTELHGTVLGTVLTFQFYVYQSPTAYINWLLDGTISRKGRPGNYTLPIGFNEKKKYKLLTWQEVNS